VTENTTGSYASVNGLELYYEVHGKGEPLLLLHGGMTTIDDFAVLLPGFAQTRQVIAYERQGHGHTADIDRPFTLESWADDAAALLQHLNIEKADVLGYSTGGSVALALAMRHPNLIRKLVLVSTIYTADGYPPEMFEGLKHMTADDLPPIMRETCERVAPRPEDWPKLVAKSVESLKTFTGWRAEDIQGIQVPTLLIIGDGDIVLPEHAVEMFRLLPQGKMAVLPDTDHITILFQRGEWLLPMVEAFLSATPEAE
jgi:pimeloyl-ACP methyl ester carboxylesterase